MTKKIIKCKYFVKEYEDFTNVCELGVIGKDGSFMACEYNPDCYYKQLKRLEQENKELKKFKKEVLKPVIFPNIEEEVTNKYRSALEEIRDINKLFFERKYGYSEDLIEIDNIINEVLQCE